MTTVLAIMIKAEIIKMIDAHQHDFFMMENSKHWSTEAAGKADGRKARVREKKLWGMGEIGFYGARTHLLGFEKQRWQGARWLGVHWGSCIHDKERETETLRCCGEAAPRAGTRIC
jgi:hypothetical protein